MSAKLREKANLCEFTLTTSATPAEIQQVGKRVADAEKRTMGSSVREINAGPAQITYAVKGPGGLIQQMQMALKISDDGTARKVSFEVGEFLTSKPTVLGFIPIGPATAPAMKTLERFSSRLRSELS